MISVRLKKEKTEQVMSATASFIENIYISSTDNKIVWLQN